MMMSLFSVFDPVGLMMIPLNWFSMILVIFLFQSIYYVVFSGGGSIMSTVVDSVAMLMKGISYPNFLGLVCVGVLFFVFIGFNNSLGLFPYVFTATSHLSVTFSMGLVVWFSLFMMGWLKGFKFSSAHLVPEGAPIVLAPFMVLIESVSHLIRPITLSVRLAANMMAGHLIVGLIASLSELSFWGVVSSIFMQSILMLLEIAVAFIQAFVFSVLVILYALEYY